MKISLKWLSDFVDIKDYLQKPEALAEALTRAGLEVEGIENKAKDFRFVVVGLILEKDKHPQADKLTLCKVTTGEGVIHQIVCGAKNHNVNDRVVVALPGAVLPGNFSIERSIIRGVESSGMLCSAKELGLSEESQGILILPGSAQIGQPFAEHFGMDDVEFEVKLTPNRSDCLSHFGLAREISCLLGKELRRPAGNFSTAEASSKKEVSVEVADHDLCPRYCGRYMEGVKIKPSPDWVQRRLKSLGINPINNVVDATNYVMLETGQPLHAFDVREIKGRKIRVEKCKPKENFVSLDGTEVQLTGEELVIRDSERVVALAGVVGGKNSGIQDSTTQIFLEAANFNPTSVRRTARTLGINTDSSYRFSRGVDANSTMKALDRLAQLILEWAGGVAFSDPHDIYPSPVTRTAVDVSIATISNRMGYTADANVFLKFIPALGCEVKEKTEAGSADRRFSVLPPSYRFDLESEMDFVEEYARLYGYEHIPESIPELTLTPTQNDQAFLKSEKAAHNLRGFGFHQALNLAFVSAAAETKFLGDKSRLQRLGLGHQGQHVKLMNPLSEEGGALRASLAWPLWKSMTGNYRQGNEEGRLFEIGTCFQNKDGNYQEAFHLGVTAWGEAQGLWGKQESVPLFFQVKSAVESLLNGFRLENLDWRATAKTDIPDFAHQGQCVSIFAGNHAVGFLAAIHPGLLEEEKIRCPVVLAEINWTAVLAAQTHSPRYRGFSRFPVVKRDLSLEVPKNMLVKDIQAEIKNSAGAHFVGVDVLDQFTGEKLGPGQKSVTFRLSFQDRNATLQDEVVVKAMESVTQGLKQKLSLSVR